MWPAAANHLGEWDSSHQSITPAPSEVVDVKPGPCNKRASPFEVATGNFIQDGFDLFIPALGPDFMLVRTYNSLDQRSGLFGRGWNFFYDRKLVETTDEVNLFAICRDGDGRRERYLRNLDGSYTPPPYVFAALAKNGDGTFTLDAEDHIRYGFNSDGRLASITDSDGNTLTIAYDSAGFLTSITDANGRTVNLSKGANGHVESMTDFTGRTYRYAYDAAGNLTSVTDPMGAIVRYEYDARGRLLKMVDSLGKTVRTITYDGEGRVATYTTGNNTWTVTYNPAQKRTTKRNSSGNTWTYDYDDQGTVLRVTDPVGTVEGYTYGDTSLVTQVTRGGEKTGAAAFDARGRPTMLADALGGTVQFTIDPATGRVASLADPQGNVTNFAYDSSARLAAITDALGNTTSRTYSEKGLLTAITDSTGGTYALSYDANGYLTSILDPQGNSTAFTYNPLGALTSVTDAENRQTTYRYDDMLRLTGTTDPNGGVTRYGYDLNGNVTFITDPKGNATSLEYDAFNRLSRTTNPAGQGTTYRYDNLNNLLDVNITGGSGFSYRYDRVNQLTQTAYGNGNVQYEHDVRGNLTRVQTSESNLTFGYDKSNRLIQAGTAPTQAQPATVIQYAYNADGTRRSMTDTQGGVTTYEYDGTKRLRRMVNPRGESIEIRYAANDFPAEIRGPGPVVRTYTYDETGRLTGLAHESGGKQLFRREYAYNRAGNITAIGESGETHTFSYDPLARLTAATHPQPSNPRESFTYDSAGNRTASHLSSAYTYDASNRMVADDKYTYRYEATGNLVDRTEKGTTRVTRFQYDGLNRLTRIDYPDRTFASYRYDGLNRRIERNANGQITRYIYDEASVLLELDGSNNIVARYTRNPVTDEVLSVERGGSRYYYHAGADGSILGVSDANGNLVASYTYDSFGQIVDRTGSLPNPYTFIGRELDSESGYYYLGARTYDPASGRFLQEDPIGLNGGDLNAYRYALGNPIDLVDPTGLCHVWVEFKLLFAGKHHAYILTEDSDSGSQPNVYHAFASGAPKGKWGYLARSMVGRVFGRISGRSRALNFLNRMFPGAGAGGSGSSLGSAGYLMPDWGRYKPGNVDYAPASAKRPRMEILNDDIPCECYNKLLGAAMRDLFDRYVPYNPVYTNSNAAVYTALLRAGLISPETLPPVSAPGWHNNLLDDR